MRGTYAPGLARPTIPLVITAARRDQGLARGSLYLWASLLGVQLTQPFIPNFNIALSDFVLAFCLLLVLTDRASARRALAMPARLGWFFAVLFVALVVGCVIDLAYYGEVPTDAWLNKGLGMFVLLAVVMCVRGVAHTREALISLFRALLIGGLVSATIAVGIWLSELGPGVADRFTGFLINPNAAALYYTICLMLILASVAGTPYAFGTTAMKIIGAAVLAVINVISISLSALAGAVFGFAVLVVTLGRGRAPAVAGLLIAAVLGLSSLDFVLAPLGSGEGDAVELAQAARASAGTTAIDNGQGQILSVWRDQFVRGAASNKAQSVFDRVAIDVIAVDKWLNDPGTFVLGIGLGAYLLTAIDAPVGLAAIIHNTYLWLLVEMGLPGAIALGLLLWYLAEVSRRLFQRVDRATASALCACFAYFLVWWLFNEGLYQRLFWLVVGVASVLVQLGPLWNARPVAARPRARIRPVVGRTPA
jgi:hypothetical protein